MPLSSERLGFSPQPLNLTPCTPVSFPKEQILSDFNLYSPGRFGDDQNRPAIQGDAQPSSTKDARASLLEILVKADKRGMEYVLTRLQLDAQLLSEILPLDLALQTVINKTDSRLLVWVEGSEGTVIARSTSPKAVPLPVSEWMSIAKTRSRSEIHQVGQHSLLLCSSSLTIAGKVVGRIYIAQNITGIQRLAMSALRSLAFSCIIGTFSVGTQVFRMQRF
jgi:hypothetical protein